MQIKSTVELFLFLNQVFVNINSTNPYRGFSCEELLCFDQAYEQHFGLVDNRWQNWGTG